MPKLQELNVSFHADIYRIIWKTSIKPILKDLVKEIMSSPEMSEAERRGKIYAYNEILRGYMKMYENSKLTVPDWLLEELDV